MQLVEGQVAATVGAASGPRRPAPCGRSCRRSSGATSSPCGLARQAAYSTTRASARTAASTAGYDGTEPRPAVLPATSGTRSSSGMPSLAEERRDQRLVGLLPDGGEHVGDLLAGGVQRRDEDRDHRVDLGVVDRRVEGLLEVLGGGVGAERDRLARPAGPTATAASAASSPSASELPTTATRLPRGSGWCASSWATSNISSRVSTWITPACRNIASTAACGASIERTAWPIGTPWVDRPDFTAITGLRRETRRASRENLRGLPIDSR